MATILTCAVTGGAPIQNNPAVPITPEQIATQAIDVQAMRDKEPLGLVEDARPDVALQHEYIGIADAERVSIAAKSEERAEGRPISVGEDRRTLCRHGGRRDGRVEGADAFDLARPIDRDG